MSADAVPRCRAVHIDVDHEIDVKTELVADILSQEYIEVEEHTTARMTSTEAEDISRSIDLLQSNFRKVQVSSRSS